MSALPFQDLLDESLDEAQFLWRRWRQELVSPTRNLQEIFSWTEDRLQGALDGVRTAPPAVMETMLNAALQSDEPIAIAIAAHLLTTARTSNANNLLCDSVRAASGSKLDSLVDGFQLAALDGGFAPVGKTFAKTSQQHIAALCRLKAFRRVTLGEELVITFESKLPELQAIALHAAAFLSSERVDPWIKAGLDHSDAKVRIAAMLTGIRRRHSGAWNAATQLVRMAHQDAAALLNCAAMLGGTSEHQAIFAAVDHPELNTAATQALGTVGTRDAVDRCISAMSNEALARLAGESYCAITGASLERDSLAMEEVDDPTPTFENDDLDANLVPSEQALWPLPNVAAIKQHWASIQSSYTPDTRYVRGRRSDTQTLIEMIDNAPMLRRPDWIFEVAVRTQGQYDVEPRDFTRQQQTMMRESRARITS